MEWSLGVWGIGSLLQDNAHDEVTLIYTNVLC